MTDELKNELSHFRRRYDRCDCLGWDERFEGVNVRWALGGDILGVEPNGEAVVGRSNHKRGCERAGDDLEPQRSRIAALEAVIQQMRDAWESSTDWPTFGGAFSRALRAAGSSTVLDQMIREAKAEAWDEGRESIALDFTRPPDEAGMRAATPNPYRNGDV